MNRVPLDRFNGRIIHGTRPSPSYLSKDEEHELSAIVFSDVAVYVMETSKMMLVQIAIGFSVSASGGYMKTVLFMMTPSPMIVFALCANILFYTIKLVLLTITLSSIHFH